MCGLLPRSPMPHNPGRSSGSPCLSFCGGLHHLSSGRLCRTSKTYLATSGCSDGLCTGDCAPLGAGVCGPICTGVSSTASPAGSSSPHLPRGIPPLPQPPPRWSRQQSPLPTSRITSSNTALSRPAALPAQSSPIRSPTSRLGTRAGPPNPTIWAQACWTCT